MASKSTEPTSLLTTSRILIEQLELFEQGLEQRKHQTVQHVLTDFAIIKQAMLDVKRSQNTVTDGLERSESVPILSHHLPGEFLVENPPKACYRIMPMKPTETAGVPYDSVGNGYLWARDIGAPRTLQTAQDHLLWKHCRTPFISVFNDQERALQRAKTLANKYKEIQFALVEIDTSSPGSRLLYDAAKLAKYLDFPEFRINYHRSEYLWLGPIDVRYITQISDLRA